MRVMLAGLVIVLSSSALLAQAEGEVESIGFAGLYRPNCWTPLKLRLTSKTTQARDYIIQVIQEDIDGDHVSYTRPVTLNGSPEGGRNEEQAWTYFIPQPHGLWDPRSQLTPGEMSERIRVFLCSKSGQQLTPIAIPPATPILRNINAPGLFNSNRGSRLILVISSGTAWPFLDDVYYGSRGINEELVFQRALAGELPDNVIGYQAVDSIVWLNPEPGRLSNDVLAAILDYVREGGRLVICHGDNWQSARTARWRS